MKEYTTAKMDKRTKILTIITLLFLLLLPVFPFVFEPRNNVISVLSLVIILIVIISAYGLIPKKIIVNDSIIFVKNTFGKIAIPLHKINSIKRLEKKNLNFRTFGVGGLFGYFGYFNGREVWSVTNVEKKVKIKLDSGKVYVMSPEDPEEFMSDIQTRLQ